MRLSSWPGWARSRATRAGGFSLGMGQRLGVAAALLGQPFAGRAALPSPFERINDDNDSFAFGADAQRFRRQPAPVA